MNLYEATILTYTYICTIGTGLAVHDVMCNLCLYRGVNIDQGMPDKNDEKYPVLWAYPLAVPSFLSKGLRMPIMDLLLT